MEKKIKELKEKAMKLIVASRKVLDHAEKEKRDLTKEERTNYDKMFNDALDLKADAERMEGQLKFEKEMAEPEARAIVPGTEQTEAREIEHRQAMEIYLRKSNDTGLRALQIDSPTAGGYLIPQQMSDRIIRALDQKVFFRSLANVTQVPNSDSLGIVTLDADPADAEWTSEVGTVSEDSSMAFGKREFKPHLLAKLLKVSQRLVEKSPGIINLVSDRLAYKIAAPEENNFLNGNGSGKPLGVFTASDDGIPTSKDISTGNTATAFTMAGLKAVKWGLPTEYLANATWIMHRDAVAILDGLKDGNGQYLWQPATQVGAPDILLGRPLKISAWAPNTFTTGLYAGILGDFKFYEIADSMSISIQVLKELYARTNQIGYIIRKETDGQPSLGDAFRRITLA